MMSLLYMSPGWSQSYYVPENENILEVLILLPPSLRVKFQVCGASTPRLSFCNTDDRIQGLKHVRLHSVNQGLPLAHCVDPIAVLLHD